MERREKRKARLAKGVFGNDEENEEDLMDLLDKEGIDLISAPTKDDAKGQDGMPATS